MPAQLGTRSQRWNGQVSHLLLSAGEFGCQHLAVTWVECAPGSQEELHAHRASEQAYLIVEGRGETIVGDSFHRTRASR